MNTIEIKNLHFSYNAGEEILKGLNLTIDERSTAIIGQNGAGKTTFVKLLKGLLRPTEGQILFNGRIFPNRQLQPWQKILDLFSRIRMTRFSKIQFWMK